MNEKLKTLVIDDDDSVMRVFCLLLERLGCETKMSLNTESAIKIYKNYLQEVDIVFLDYRVPGENFYKSISELLEIKKDIKIIVITGALYDDEIPKMKEAGAYKSVAKPVTIEELERIIRE